MDSLFLPVVFCLIDQLTLSFVSVSVVVAVLEGISCGMQIQSSSSEILSLRTMPCPCWDQFFNLIAFQFINDFSTILVI